MSSSSFSITPSKRSTPIDILFDGDIRKIIKESYYISDSEDYNSDVDDYNSDVDDYNSDVDDYNSDVDDYNSQHKHTTVNKLRPPLESKCYIPCIPQIQAGDAADYESFTENAIVAFNSNKELFIKKSLNSLSINDINQIMYNTCIIKECLHKILK
jgi:hypothetical protein